MIPWEHRTDPNRGHSPEKLHNHGIIQAVLTILVFCVGTPALYAWISWTWGDGPNGVLSVLLFPLGMIIGAAVFFPAHYRHAKKKRAEFISVGGDPTGITPFMFGAMGGRKLKDGSWEWYAEPSYGDGGNSVA